MVFRGLTYFIAVAVLLTWVPSIFAASVSVEKDTNSKDKLILENNLIRLEIDPQRGARVSSFRFKPWGDTEIIQDKMGQGLFVDHFWQEMWPGQFWETDYNYQVISRGPHEVSVKFSRLSQNKGIPGVAGILLEKTLTLKENSRVVKVNISLTNNSSEGKYVGYWLQNICWLGGDKTGDYYFRPTIRGISKVDSDNSSPPDGGFVHEPQAGWTAAIDERSKTGLVFLLDYNYLWFLYNCTPSSTIEWQYDGVAISPGKTWQTEIALIPISDMASLSFASENILASVELKENKGKKQIAVTQTFLAAENLVKSAEVTAGLETLVSREIQTAVRSKGLNNLGFKPQEVSVALPYNTQKREPLAVRVTIKGKTTQAETFTEHMELWYGGSLGENRDPAGGAPFYKIPTPAKQKTLIKPDKIVRTYKEHPQVLFLKGLLANTYKLESAIDKIDPASQVKEGYAYCSVFGQQLDYFPYDYDTLMSYDLIIIGDISAAHIGDTGMEMLKDYCKYGGNLLVLGGPFAYGNGGYKGTALDEILPVLSQGPFDLKAVDGVMKWTPGQKMIKTGSLDALKPGYIHYVKVKPAAKVLLTCGEDPFLVAGAYGDGTVMCITGTPLGSSAFCNTQQWQEVLVNILDYSGLKKKGGSGGDK